MPIKHSFTSTTRFTWVGLPFSGLGFDLAPVADKAQTLTIRLLTRRAPGVVHPMHALVPRAFGYELLVSLSRETRGR